MAWFLGQSLFVILAAFLLGVLVGWLWWGRRPDVAPSASASASAPEEPAAQPSELSLADQPEELARAAVPDPPQLVDVEAPTPSTVDTELEPVELEAPATEAAPIEAPLTIAAEAVPIEAVAAPVGTLLLAAPADPSAENASAAEVPAENPAEDVEPANLQRIEGIGPKMAEALRRADIRTFGELAAADETRLRAAIAAAGLKFAPSLVTWARQARFLADGDEEGFANLARRLVAGRDVGRP